MAATKLTAKDRRERRKRAPGIAPKTLARLGKRLIDALVSTAKVDAEPLVRFLLGQRS